MLLYHFTSPQGLAGIQHAQEILPTESNIGSPSPTMRPYGEHVGPDVVWLLDTPTADDHSHGLVGSVRDKRLVRITVDLPRVTRWLDWAHTAEMHPLWRESLILAAGGEQAVEHWYVHPAAIPSRRWVEVALRPSEGGEYEAL